MIKNFLKYHPIHKKLVKYLDLLFILRPSLFFPVWIMIASGMITSSMQNDRFRIWINEFNLNTFLVFLGVTIICGATFIINQMQDIVSDQENDKLVLFKEKMTQSTADRFYKILMIVSIIILIPTGVINIVLGLLLFLIWGVLYNLKPFEFKQTPILGAIINLMAGLILFLIGWSLNVDINFQALILAAPYLLCFTAVSVLTAIPDMRGDKKINKNTIPVLYGERITIFFAAVFVLIAFGLGYQNDDPIISTASLVSLPFYVFNVFSLKLNNILRTIRFSIFNLGFFLMSVYPYLFLAFFVNFYLVKYYYWHRFDLHYISFLIEE